MFTARNAIIAAVIVTVASIGFNVLKILDSPDSGGRATDSFGTHWNGFRAVFELLGESGVKVERRTGPPEADLPASTTLVLLVPDAGIVATEPAYLERLLSWVEAGGRIVAAPVFAPPERGFHETKPKTTQAAKLLDVLGVEGVTVEQQKPVDDQDEDKSATDSERRRRIRERMRQTWQDAWQPRTFECATVATSVTGTFPLDPARVAHLYLPAEAQRRLELAEPKEASGLLEARADESDEPRTLAASFRRGKGEIIVLAEPALTDELLPGARRQRRLRLRSTGPGRPPRRVRRVLPRSFRAGKSVLAAHPAPIRGRRVGCPGIRFAAHLAASRRLGTAAGDRAPLAAHDPGIRRCHGSLLPRRTRQSIVRAVGSPRRRATLARRTAGAIARRVDPGEYRLGSGPAVAHRRPAIPGSRDPIELCVRSRPSLFRARSSSRTTRNFRLSLDQLYRSIRAEIAKVVFGQDEVVDFALAALFSSGHVLLEGPPGVAKTLLVRTIAAALSLDYRRIQMTPDLLPGDITGSVDLPAGRRCLRVSPRADLRQFRAGRRNQPSLGPHAVRPARSHARAGRHVTTA